jgi:fucose 4-O-acetylase-like acetyltransferase
MKQRNFYFDNAKFILIFFVVFGHMIRPFIEDNEVIFTIYKVIYSFHMPAFILVSGFFAKGFYQKGYIIKITKKLIVPYLIFQLIYSIYYYYLNGQSKIEWDLLNPHWSLWFLISLFFWNLMLLLVSKYKAFTSITIALVVGLLVGYVDSVTNYLSLSRTFVFFPFFLLGYYLKKEHICSLFKLRYRLVALAVFIIVFVGFYFYPNFNYEWLLGSKPYGDISGESITAMLTRLGFYLLSILMVLSFMSFVPRKQYFFTQLGKNTLYVYLLHGFFIKKFRKSEIQNYFHDPEQFILLAGMALLLTLVLSSRIATSLIQPLIEFKWSKLKLLIARGRAILKYYMQKFQSN